MTAIVRKESVAIVGPRRIGKSSVLREAYRRLASLEYVPIYLNMSMFDSEVSFIRTLIDKLGGTAMQEGQSSSSETPTWVDLPEYIQNLGLKRGAVLLLDEFHRPPNFSDTFFYGLRGCASLGLLPLIFALTQELEDLHLESGPNSTLTNIFKSVRLGEFKARESYQLATFNGQVDFLPAELAFVMAETKGHPYHIQILCGLLIEAKNRGQGTADLETVAAEFAKRVKLLSS